MNYNNPFIKVTWSDVPENFTSEKIKRVKSYFQNKYATKNIKVITKNIIYNKDTKLKSLDISDNILDVNYQKVLMQEFIKENKITVDWTKLDKLDNKVNEKISEQNHNKVKYNKWYINKIEFSNFLSFGLDNVIDFNSMSGLSVVESNPRNFGGKSTATVDLLLFLFFNTTTKTKTNIEIFNKFTDHDDVLVKGYITIDNENYIIERRLNRKKSKNGEYTVTSKLEFFKIDDNQQIVNLTGEQRRETETFITSAIGTEEDFLATILTTGYNLEQLIESKPTARGQILSKFLGLDTLKQKEEIAKEIYNEWSKKLVSNSYNIVELEKQIFSNDELIASTKKELFDTNKKLSENENQLKKYEKEKDNLLLKRNNDIDKDLLNINTDLLKSTIEDLKRNKVEIIKKIGSVSLVEPSEYYLESEYNTISKNIEKFNFERYKHKETISQKEKNIKSLVEGLVCPTCNRKLDEIDHTDEINKLKNELIELKKVDYDTKINELQEQFNKQVKLKNDYDTYEKNKLIVEKYKLELEQKDLDIEKKENSLNNYYKNESKLNENKKIDQELIKVKTNIETLNGEIRQLNNNITKHQTGIKILNDKSTNYQELIKKIKIEQDTLQIFKVYFTVYGKNGITKVIMKNMIPLINSELYRLLVDSCYFILELNINDKNEVEFIMIDTETRIVKPLSAGSGYERTISSLALRSVLTKISSLPKPNVVVMDEVFGKIADENLEMVGEFFKKIKNYFEQIFIISHNPLIRNWSDNVIVIKKEDNVSSIEYIKKISINL